MPEVGVIFVNSTFVLNNEQIDKKKGRKIENLLGGIYF